MSVRIGLIGFGVVVRSDEHVREARAALPGVAIHSLLGSLGSLIDAGVDASAGPTDSAFVLTIEHESGAHSHVSATKLGGVNSGGLRLFGEHGSYRSDYSDVQVVWILAGERPKGRGADWGYEAAARWGTLSVVGKSRNIASLQGNYTNYYDRFAAAVASGGPRPVPAHQGVEVLRVLDGARLSAAEHRIVTLANI